MLLLWLRLPRPPSLLLRLRLRCRRSSRSRCLAEPDVEQHQQQPQCLEWPRQEKQQQQTAPTASMVRTVPASIVVLKNRSKSIPFFTQPPCRLCKAREIDDVVYWYLIQ